MENQLTVFTFGGDDDPFLGPNMGWRMTPTPLPMEIEEPVPPEPEVVDVKFITSDEPPAKVKKKKPPVLAKTKKKK